MLNKIILGAANFTQPYGILSGGKVLPREQVLSILSEATDKISTLDTAFVYGDLRSIVPSSELKKFQIITKFSVLESYNDILKKMNTYYEDQSIYGILVHDPQNLPFVEKSSLIKLFDSLRQNLGIKKIGVSVYDLKDFENFKKICMPEIIQIPLNPFNHTFNSNYFKSYAKENGVEVHARSLFLQGVLLADALPKKLDPLKPAWLKMQEVLKTYPSRLHGLLNWAFSKEWIKSWILGVSSLRDLKDIMEITQSIHLDNAIDFSPVDHPLVDPRHWELT